MSPDCFVTYLPDRSFARGLSINRLTVERPFRSLHHEPERILPSALANLVCDRSLGRTHRQAGCRDTQRLHDLGQRISEVLAHVRAG